MYCQTYRIPLSFSIFVFSVARACLKIHFRHLHAPLRGIFGPNSLNVAYYAALIRAKSPTKCDAQLTKSNFQTRSNAMFNLSYLVSSNNHKRGMKRKHPEI
ncbi:DUF6783 domain-containing protein [[Clostridium] symbiosum]|uniref:DUF6783 domain-containing protein n=1 Tax=Clostridium symbiosum TaxID=1512 RepID=UPI0011C042E5